MPKYKLVESKSKNFRYAALWKEPCEDKVKSRRRNFGNPKKQTPSSINIEKQKSVKNYDINNEIEKEQAKQIIRAFKKKNKDKIKITYSRQFFESRYLYK